MEADPHGARLSARLTSPVWPCGGQGSITNGAEAFHGGVYRVSSTNTSLARTCHRALPEGKEAVAWAVPSGCDESGIAGTWSHKKVTGDC